MSVSWRDECEQEGYMSVSRRDMSVVGGVRDECE